MMKFWNFAILIAQVAVLGITVFLLVPVMSADLVEGEKLDAISVASQMGRLDVISLVFALFGIILALFAFGGFFSVKAHVENIATKLTREVAEDIAAEKIDQFISSSSAKLTNQTEYRVHDFDTNTSTIMKDDTETNDDEPS